MEELSRAKRVVLVSPHALTRMGLVGLVELIDGVQVVGHCGTVADGIRLAQSRMPDVVLLEAELAADDGMRAVASIKELEGPRVALIAERPVQSQIVSALEAGTDAYTLKDITLAELSSVIDRLMEGDTVLHPEVAAHIARSFQSGGRNAPLTVRQREILRLLASGLDNKQIARALGIGLHTVKTHVSRVLAKLGAQSRTEAVVVALRDRLIS